MAAEDANGRVVCLTLCWQKHFGVQQNAIVSYAILSSAACVVHFCVVQAWLLSGADAVLWVCVFVWMFCWLVYVSEKTSN